ncbi:hypothetical protein LPJ56_003578 [Coemansia sp. RSA 2599]|nr:hypothetical protein LPJ75_003338 [Coemansia sp. RSA 2598]KAJ1819792.1 hypothetical protein LPJ56_003578 [Coemansia sp. RSA 2599]
MATVKRQVLVVPKQQQGQKLKQLRLPHPRTGNLGSYYVDIENEVVLEAATVDMKGKRSWLGSDWVMGDGSVSVLVPIDPLFLYLGLLTKISKAGNDDEWKYVDISVLQLETYDQMDAFSINRLFSMIGVQVRALNELCEAKEISDSMSVVRIDSAKVLSWLKRKCSAERFPTAMEGIISSKAGDKELVEQAKTREMALLVSEYLPTYWTHRLFEEFGGFASVQNSDQILTKRVQAIQFDSPDSYAMGVPTPQTLAMANKVDKPKTAKEKQMEKAAKRSKPITSFFQKKNSSGTKDTKQ